MSKSDSEFLQGAVNRFIELANTLAAEEGATQQMVSVAMMSASGVYATFAAGGNEAVLTPEGVDKTVEAYRQQLEHVQVARREQLEGAGKS